MWIFQHHSQHALYLGTNIVLCIRGCSSNKSSLAERTLAIQVVYMCLHADMWLDLMTSKADAFSTLGYHWADNTGTTLDDAITQWQSRAHHVHNWNILEYHWRYRYTGMPLEPHWLMLAPSEVVSQWQSSDNLHNWNTLEHHWSHKYTEMTLEPHWLMR